VAAHSIGAIRTYHLHNPATLVPFLQGSQPISIFSFPCFWAQQSLPELLVARKFRAVRNTSQPEIFKLSFISRKDPTSHQELSGMDCAQMRVGGDR
ncbi:MAG TPA: hypothetical protein VJ372_20115, partial [Pyrinomonadaceae bacterium]|nr:hypothetical protein [Pyrinomonadaceae bacterium]